MEKNVREKALHLFVDMSGSAAAKARRFVHARPRPAFMIRSSSALSRSGSCCFCRFSSSIWWSPRCCVDGDDDAAAGRVSLPFKLIFFVLVDGWTPVAGALIQSYGPSGEPLPWRRARIAARGDAFRKIRDTGARNTWELSALSGRHTNRRSLWDSDVEYCFGCWGYRCQSSFCWRFSGTTEGPNAEVGRQNLEIGKLEVGIGSWHS